MVPYCAHFLTYPTLGAPRRAIDPVEGHLIPQLPLEGAGKPSFTARIERPPLYRGGSASKMDGCLLPRIPCPVEFPMREAYSFLP